MRQSGDALMRRRSALERDRGITAAPGESRFRVRLLRTDDPQLRLIVTVLAFNVPAVRSE